MQVFCMAFFVFGCQSCKGVFDKRTCTWDNVQSGTESVFDKSAARCDNLYAD